jgi:uncharacterized repeat protein (TIGR03803 family)
MLCNTATFILRDCFDRKSTLKLSVLRRCFFIVLTLWVGGSASYASPSYQVLHRFLGSGSGGDGATPNGSLLMSSGTLYGMTSRGGSQDRGTIFKIGQDGSGYGVLHSFQVANTDGVDPSGSLISANGNLYGMTENGGAGGAGTVFQVRPDGSNFALVHSFSQRVPGLADANGGYAHGSLFQSGSTFYGMTSSGGSQNLGVLFAVGSDGANYHVIHDFAGGPNGSTPYFDSSVIGLGATLYGMTEAGGLSDRGTVFKVGTDGNGFSVLHSFSSDGNGANPWGSLIQQGSILYGMTYRSDAQGGGTIFRMGVDGSGFEILHRFTNGGIGGDSPTGGLIMSGSTLYGMTSGGAGSGGTGYGGTIFEMQMDGSNFNVLHSFIVDDLGGDTPFGTLVQSGSALYGMTRAGGDPSALAGTIFALTVPEPSSAILLACISCCLLLRGKRQARSRTAYPAPFGVVLMNLKIPFEWVRESTSWNVGAGGRT